jgi:hypothetical protein
VDSGKILLPTLSGVALASYKIILALLVSAVLGLAGIVVLIGGLVAYTMRSVFGYLNTQNKYQLNLTRSLYFQNLDNSSGVLLRLTDEAEHQDLCETVLAYFLLWRDAASHGYSTAELDCSAEKFLSDLCGHDIDFQVDDALEKLQCWGLATTTADGRWRATNLHDASLKLQRIWESFFSERAPIAM